MDKKLRILVVNDDGIYAPGIKILEECARELSEDVWVVAPEQEQSSSSRSLTVKSPLRVSRIEEKRFAVSGTPTDCMILALLNLMKETPPDLIVSGINYGQNLAEDVHFSGTIAAAMQAMQFGFRSIAFSLSIHLSGEDKIHWETAQLHTPMIMKSLMGLEYWPSNILYSVNFPDCAPGQVQGLEATHVGKRDYRLQHVDQRTDLKGNPYYWLGYSGSRSNPPEGVDLKAIYENRISITPLQANLTDVNMVESLKPMIKDLNVLTRDRVLE